MSIEEQIALLNQRIQKLSSNGKNTENVGVLRSNQARILGYL